MKKLFKIVATMTPENGLQTDQEAIRARWTEKAKTDSDYASLLKIFNMDVPCVKDDAHKEWAKHGMVQNYSNERKKEFWAAYYPAFYAIPRGHHLWFVHCNLGEYLDESGICECRTIKPSIDKWLKMAEKWLSERRGRYTIESSDSEAIPYLLGLLRNGLSTYYTRIGLCATGEPCEQCQKTDADAKTE